MCTNETAFRLNSCQRAVDPSLISVLLRGALSSPEAEIRVAATAAVRMSLGSLTTPECIDRVAELFPALITKARRLAGVTS